MVIRVWAVAVLALGIVVMHHVAQPSHDSPVGHEASITQAGPGGHEMGSASAPVEPHGAPMDADSDEAPAGGHGLLHLCLAVLTAAAAALMGWLLVVRRVWSMMPPVPALWSRLVPASPPPRPYGATLLRSLCVMRT